MVIDVVYDHVHIDVCILVQDLFLSFQFLVVNENQLDQVLDLLLVNIVQVDIFQFQENEVFPMKINEDEIDEFLNST
jgi:hypothetical protein